MADLTNAPFSYSQGNGTSIASLGHTVVTNSPNTTTGGINGSAASTSPGTTAEEQQTRSAPAPVTTGPGRKTVRDWAAGRRIAAGVCSSWRGPSISTVRD